MRTEAAADADESDNQALDAVDGLLGAWRMNGQVCGREWAILRQPDGYSALVLTPEADSLDPGFNNATTHVVVARAEAAGLRLASQRLGEDAEGLPACACGPATACALFTTYVSLESPVRCLACFRSVPLYRLPALANDEFSDVISWQSDYQSCDSLQMNGTVLESEATQQISSLDSSLTQNGRALGNTLAESSGRPFYYYLYRGYSGSPEGEATRPCPGCGGEWALAERLHGMFDFQCDHCRLLSNIAFDVQGE